MREAHRGIRRIDGLPTGPRRAIHINVEIVRVTFADNGLGMTEAQRKSAFGSVLQSSKKKGTGLGLAIVRRVIETHHGKLEIKSRRGKGTAISIVLPA